MGSECVEPQVMKNILVTGGGGFVGTAIVSRLLQEGCRVKVAGRHTYKHLLEMGVECVPGDIADKNYSESVCRDVDTVFHTAAKAGIWGKWAEYYNSNVAGTENIIEGCHRHGVQRLIYTSTPSVVFDNKNIEGGGESLPYPSAYLCHYAHTKVLAEKKVLSGKGSELRTCAIRPHLIWGPGDPHLIPRLVERGRKKALKIVGNGRNIVDITFIDNVAHAHMLAAQSLERSVQANGKAYFIGQEKPVRLWEWINNLFKELGIPPVKRRVPFIIAYFIGNILENAYRLSGSDSEPKMTRFLARQLSSSHYFSHENARKDLGYNPVVTIEEGMHKLIWWLKEK